jgi:hypothetical protein
MRVKINTRRAFYAYSEFHSYVIHKIDRYSLFAFYLNIIMSDSKANQDQDHANLENSKAIGNYVIGIHSCRKANWRGDIWKSALRNSLAFRRESIANDRWPSKYLRKIASPT